MRNRTWIGTAVLLSVLGAIAPALAEDPTLVPIGDGEALRRAAAAPPESALPGHDAYVLYEGLFVTYRDGKAEVRRQRLTRLYNEWAMDELGDPRLSHDATRQELVIHASRTYLAGGETVDTPENGFNEVTPDGIDRSVDHLGYRETVVTHTGLVPGAVVFLDWTVCDTVPESGPFDMVFFPNGRFGAAEVVVVAEGLRGETVSPETALCELPDPRGESGRLVWHLKDLGPGPLSAGTREGDELPWIALSSADDWEKAIAPAARNIEAAAASNAGLSGVLADLEKDAPFLSDREALIGMATAAKERTDLVDHEAWHRFREPRSVEKTLARSFATPMERCAFLLACCRARGLDASIVFPVRWQAITEHVPAFECLGHPGLRVTDGHGGVWWVDPVEGVVGAHPGFGAGFTYFVCDGKSVAREKTPAETSRVEIAFRWDLAEGTAKCEGRILGPAALGLAGGDPGNTLEKWMAEWGDSAEAASVSVSESTPDRLVFVAGAKVPLASPDERGRVILPLPVAPLPIADLLPHVSTVHRASDRVLFSDAPVEVRLSWRVRTPEERDVLPAGPVEKECPGGSLSIRRSGQGREIDVSYTLAWDGRVVKPDSYPEFRAFLVEALDEANVRLVLGAKKAKAKKES